MSLPRGEGTGGVGNPFVAGKAAIHHGSMYYGPAGAVAQIGRRFQWSLGLPSKHPGTGLAATMHEDQSHYVMNSADRAGTTEESARWLFFAASLPVSERIGIDRGNFPTHRESYTKAGTLAAPPEGMENWGASIDLPVNHSQGYHSEWQNWRDAGYWKYINDLLLNGEMGAAEAAERTQADSNAVMDKAGWPAPVTQANFYDQALVRRFDKSTSRPETTKARASRRSDPDRIAGGGRGHRPSRERRAWLGVRISKGQRFSGVWMVRDK